MQKMEMTTNTNRNLILLIAAFTAVYLFWGSTYLAIKYAIETLPPFLMAGSRFIVAGSILYIWARFSKDYEKPSFKHWRTSFIVGTLLLLGGNGGVVLAQHYISSSLAALLVATEPVWIVLLSWLWLKGTRPNWKAALGLVIGFFGVCGALAQIILAAIGGYMFDRLSPNSPFVLVAFLNLVLLILCVVLRPYIKNESPTNTNEVIISH